MDSDEEEGPQLKKRRVFFGSLEEKERMRLANAEQLISDAAVDALSSGESGDEDSKLSGEDVKGPTDVGEVAEPNAPAEEKEESAIDKAIKAGNINIAEGETLELPQDSVSDRHQELLAEFEKRKKLKSITVPTDDPTVRARLRELGHPICLFGEGPAQRRDRLRDLLSVFEQLIPGFSKQDSDQVAAEAEDKESSKVEVWYHEGPKELELARHFIADFSLPRAHNRLNQARVAMSEAESVKAAKRQEVYRKSRALINFGSQIGDLRPLSCCQFSPDSQMLATCSWSGLCKIWNVPGGELVRTLRGHNDRTSWIAFHPRATVDLDTSVTNLASCGSDGSVLLWNLESDTPLGNIDGHDQRVSCVAFHPSGRFLATACFDRSWRLWDLEREMEVLHQEGHAKECYKICFQNDGALAASCGFDARGLVWDLRTGRCVVNLDGHVKKVTAIDFSPNGYQVATGSEDQKCIIWDLRRRQAIYTIPAHSNIVSHLKFGDGALMTCSYDGTAKIWSAPMWAPLNSLSGHEQKVTCVDVASNGSYLATCSFDRTFKLWAPEYLP